MLKLSVTTRERTAGQLDSAHLETALEAMRRDGFVALDNVAEVAHLDAIYRQIVRDIAAWNATAPEPVTGGNFTPNRQSQLLFGDILMNPMVAQLVGALLGREVSCGMYSSNITMPGKGEQELHVDRKPDAPGLDPRGPCPAVVVNFPLVDFTLENGATELWPGTHHLAREAGEINVSQRLQDARRAEVAPVRAVLPRGFGARHSAVASRRAKQLRYYSPDAWPDNERWLSSGPRREGNHRQRRDVSARIARAL